MGHLGVGSKHLRVTRGRDLRHVRGAKGGRDLDEAVQPRGWLGASACFLASLALSEFAFIGFIVVAAIGVVTFLVLSRFGGRPSSSPGVARTTEMVLSGFTVLAALVYAFHSGEIVEGAVVLLWAIVYGAWALRTLAPGVLIRLAGEQRTAVVPLLAAVLSAALAFLMGGVSLAYILWLAGVVSLVLALRPGDLPHALDPRRLWQTGAARLATIGAAVAGASLGLNWATWVDFNPGVYDPYANCDPTTGFCMGDIVGGSYYSGSLSGHSHGLDLLPMVLLTGALVWLASERSETPQLGGWRWLPTAALVVLLLYAIWNNFASELGPKVFAVALVLMALGMYRRQRLTAGSTDGQSLDTEGGR